MSENKVSAATLRKRKERERKKAQGIGIIEVTLSKSQRQALDNNRAMRGGVRGEYDRDEYISTLIEQDSRRLAEQLNALGSCGKCGSALPGGCAGLFKGDQQCFHSRDYRQLMLEHPSALAINALSDDD